MVLLDGVSVFGEGFACLLQPFAVLAAESQAVFVQLPSLLRTVVEANQIFSRDDPIRYGFVPFLFGPVQLTIDFLGRVNHTGARRAHALDLLQEFRGHRIFPLVTSQIGSSPR